MVPVPRRDRPDWLVPLGRTIGIRSNGAVTNLASTPFSVTTLRQGLRAGGFDVIHIHEPHTPWVGYDALDSTLAPLVGTFHCYSENPVSNGLGNIIAGVKRKLNHLHVRIAVSEAAAWTGRRFYGGEYRIVPNGVDVPAELPPRAAAEPGAPLRLAFVGQAVERKGLPVLLRAFEALRDHVNVELLVIGSERDEVDPLLLDGGQGITILGKVSDDEKSAALAGADLLVAPSLGGESFGMVLTEALAAGTPVVASDIPGYRDVVRDGVDGVLVPRGDPTILAQTLRDLAVEPRRREAMASRARDRAQRFAWPTVAGEVLDAYRDAAAVPRATTLRQRAGVFVGAIPADLGPRRPARRLPSLEPVPGLRRAARLARRGAVAAGALGGVGGALFALRQIGLNSIAAPLLNSSPTSVLLAVALMCTAMVLRAVAWHAILRAALPETRPRFDALQGTSIGVLMSATLPARLGEPSRALIVARRLGRPREHLPVVLGTLVSQTLLNIVALTVLGAIMFQTVGLFAGRQQALLWYAVAPFVVLCAVLVAPALLRSGLPSRSERVHRWLVAARAELTRVRSGLVVFRRPRLGSLAAGTQLGAWAVQWLSCWVLLAAIGLDDRAGPGAAAAILFAVNVTAVLPLTPSNLGVFQAACVAVLTGAYGVQWADALGYGIILQAVEVATAVVMGAPALVKEGVSWREVRLRALHTTPVSLAPRTPASEGEF